MPVGRPPSGPQRLSRGEWLAVLKRTFKQFVEDDCIGMAQSIAYSSMLAFFPAVAFLLGVVGLFDLFDNMKRFLDPIAPQAPYPQGGHYDPRYDQGRHHDHGYRPHHKRRKSWLEEIFD